MKRWKEAIVLLIGLSPAIAALLMYDRLPDTMASHFGVNNEVNGTMSKNMSILMFALIGLVPSILRVARRLDPKRDSYEKFPVAYEVIRLGAGLLVVAAGWMVLLINLGYELDIRKLALIAIGLLFIVTGNYMTQVQHNYMIGIRTPWTLASEEVWRRTHRLGGPLFMIGGIVAIAVTLLAGGVTAVFASLAAIVIVSLIPVVYSYVIYVRWKA
ncbi:MAG: SdpI family protein [Paenibacillaceae bacterium]|nr:SdpI family protein [Paenibacillaceae bacterium]